ncbi:PUA-like domain-containing protein [Collybia nuda]|uniref:PUA-like domain-containing protein n=1 Tax=Collybia nuda TaxID=64659 RepID=A0A9P6CEC9_9AGAR|nr:PUA-like domain-containing protein [Collybia nuda]
MAKTNGGAHYFKGIKVDREGRNPKVHGEIPGFPVGSSWPSRVECSQAGVHAPLRAGIHGNATDGAYSIVLSGGYEDDEDNGETITYTGQGGRDTKGTLTHQLQGKTVRRHRLVSLKDPYSTIHKLWEGAQSADQEWVLGNRALKISCTTKNPVRVLRGFTLKSPYAPTEGYRYDGLYVVDDAWRAIGKTGYHTCRFIFRVCGLLIFRSAYQLKH